MGAGSRTTEGVATPSSLRRFSPQPTRVPSRRTAWKWLSAPAGLVPSASSIAGAARAIRWGVVATPEGKAPQQSTVPSECRAQLEPEIDHGADSERAEQAHHDVERQLRVRLPELGFEHLLRRRALLWRRFERLRAARARRRWRRLWGALRFGVAARVAAAEAFAGDLHRLRDRRQFVLREDVLAVGRRRGLELESGARGRTASSLALCFLLRPLSLLQGFEEEAHGRSPPAGGAGRPGLGRVRKFSSGSIERSGR